MPLAGVIFDFDGVLADSEPVHLQVFQTVLDSIGDHVDAPRSTTRSTSGYSDRDAFVQVLKDRGLAIEDARLEALLETKKELFPQAIGDHALYPGAADCIARVAADVPVAIASGALRHEIELILARSGLDGRFPVIVAAGETPRSKPAPDPYARAFALLGTSGALRAGCHTGRRRRHRGLGVGTAVGARRWPADDGGADLVRQGQPAQRRRVGAVDRGRHDPRARGPGRPDGAPARDAPRSRRVRGAGAASGRGRPRGGRPAAGARRVPGRARRRHACRSCRRSSSARRHSCRRRRHPAT